MVLHHAGVQINCSAYIPLRHKNISVGSLRWLRPPTRNFALGMPTCCYLKTLKFLLPPTQIIKFALPPMRNPNVSQWNIGCIGSQTQISGIGHVHLIFLVSISFALGPVFQWNMGFTVDPPSAPDNHAIYKILRKLKSINHFTNWLKCTIT